MKITLTKHKHQHNSRPDNPMVFYPRPTEAYPRGKDMSPITWKVGETKEIENGLAMQVVEQWGNCVAIDDTPVEQKKTVVKRPALKADKEALV